MLDSAQWGEGNSRFLGLKLDDPCDIRFPGLRGIQCLWATVDGFALSKSEMALIMGPNCVYFFDSFVFLKLILEPGQLSLVCSETTCVMRSFGPRTLLWL